MSAFSTRIYLFVYLFLLSLSQTATKCGPRPPSLLYFVFICLFIPSFFVSDGNEVWFASSFSTRIYLFIYSFLLSRSQTATKCGSRPPSPLVFICLFIPSFFLGLRRQRSVVLALLLHSYLSVHLFLPSFSVSDGNEVWSSPSFSTRIYLFTYSFLLSLSQTATKCGPRPPSPLVFICLLIRSFCLCLRR